MTEDETKKLYCPHFSNPGSRKPSYCKGSQCAMWRWDTRMWASAKSGHCGMAGPHEGRQR